MLLESATARTLGVDESRAALRFGEGAKAEGAFAGRRLMWLGDKAAFELTYWCGTCPITFERLEGANGTLSVAELEGKLRDGLAGIDPEVLTAFSELLPAGSYLPLLLRVSPRLIYPVGQDDYFAHEQVMTWGVDAFWGLPENPRTPYYRTFQTRVTDEAHLFEFVVPMVPPTWNDRARVKEYVQRLGTTSRPTVVAVSTLDISQPAVSEPAGDYYEHWALTHFVLDGHHKLEAAATAGTELQLLALVSVEGSLAKESDVARLVTLRAQMAGQRSAAVR